jgi:hypothetical protein
MASSCECGYEPSGSTKCGGGGGGKRGVLLWKLFASQPDNLKPSIQVANEGSQ